MKWPFVRRSKYESMIKEKYEQIVNLSKMLKEQNTHQIILEDKIRNKNYENIKLVQKEIRFKRTLESNQEEINRLNQELASELNSHRETRETKNKVIESNLNQIRGLEGFFEREFNLHKETKKELEEAKAALKIAQEDNKKLHKVNNECWDAAIIFVDSINSARTEFMNNK